MAFPKHVPTSWIVRSLASADKKISDLLPFEFGIFDEDTHLALTAPDVAKRRSVYFAVGSPNTKVFNQGSKQENNAGISNADVDFRSEPVSTMRVDTIRPQYPKRVEKVNIYYLGYNGVDDCKSLKFECGKTYMFNVSLKGRPVRNIFGKELQEVISIDTNSCSNCSTTACDGTEGCELYIDQLVSNFNDKNRFGSRFYTAEKVTQCTPSLPSLTKTTFNKFTLTVCDNGDAIDLSSVQNQYPTLKVTVLSRKAPFTTYEVIKTGSAPSAFTQTGVVLQNCTTCPSGYTASAAGYAYLVEIDNANPGSDLATVQAVWATVTSATKISFKNGVSTYSVVSSAALSNPAAGTDAVIVTSLGTVQARCTQTTATSTSWVANGSVYKVQRDLCMTITKDDCDADSDGADAGETLARLTSFYAAYTEVVTGTIALSADSNTCLLRYTLSQYNTEYLVDGCDTYANAAFNELAPFEGQQWTVCPCTGWTVNGAGCPIPPTPTDRCCQCGIKFTMKPTTELLDTFAGYDFNAYLETDPITLSVSAYRNDTDTDINDYPEVTWFQAQRATFRQLRGDAVVKKLIMEQFYNKVNWVNQIDKENQLLLAREGIKLGVNLDDFYYAIDVYHNVTMNGNNTANSNNLRECITLFVNEKDLATFDSLKAFVAQCFPMAKLENYV